MSRFKNLPDISPTKLQEQLHQILTRMFKMSLTICWEIRNQIQYKTQQPQKRLHQEGQYTSIKSF